MAVSRGKAAQASLTPRGQGTLRVSGPAEGRASQRQLTWASLAEGEPTHLQPQPGFAGPQGHRRKATESYRAEQWSSSSTRGSAYSPKGHGNPTSFRPSRDPEVPSASLTEPGNHCCARQEEASDDSGLHAQTPDICREFAHSAASLTAISILQIRKVALQRAGPLAQGQSAMEVSVTVQGSNKGLWGPKLKLIPTKYAAACQRYLLMSPVICPPAHEPLSYMISEDIGCQTANSINSGTVRASHCPEALTHQ